MGTKQLPVTRLPHNLAFTMNVIYCPHKCGFFSLRNLFDGWVLSLDLWFIGVISSKIYRSSGHTISAVPSHCATHFARHCFTALLLAVHVFMCKIWPCCKKCTMWWSLIPPLRALTEYMYRLMSHSRALQLTYLNLQFIDGVRAGFMGLKRWMFTAKSKIWW